MGSIARFELSKIKEQFELDFFIESGTLKGDGVEIAYNAGFRNIISIEIEEDLVLKARDRFKNYDGNITIIHGDSSILMGDILSKLQGNALFWLDAHFPGADIEKRPYRECLNYSYDTRLPLETELTIINDRQQTFEDVIIADDLWVYKPGIYGAGEINEHCARHGHNITREEIVEGRADIERLYDMYKLTHNIQERLDDQGYIIFTPKKTK
jgi:hypothetical protein